jgi:hypothetical protein
VCINSNGLTCQVLTVSDSQIPFVKSPCRLIDFGESHVAGLTRILALRCFSLVCCEAVALVRLPVGACTLYFLIGLSPVRTKLGLARGTNDSEVLDALVVRLDTISLQERRIAALEKDVKEAKSLLFEPRHLRLSDKGHPEEFEVVLQRLKLSIEEHTGEWGVSQPPWYPWTKFDHELDKLVQVKEEPGTPIVCGMLNEEFKTELANFVLEDLHENRTFLDNNILEANVQITGGTDVIGRPNPSATPLCKYLYFLGELKRLEMGKAADLKPENHRQVQGQLISALFHGQPPPPGLFAFLTNCWQWWFYDYLRGKIRKFGPFSSNEAIEHMRKRLNALPELPADLKGDEREEGSETESESDGDEQQRAVEGEGGNSGDIFEQSRQGSSGDEGKSGNSMHSMTKEGTCHPNKDRAMYEAYEELDELGDLGRHVHLVFTC